MAKDENFELDNLNLDIANILHLDKYIVLFEK